MIHELIVHLSAYHKRLMEGGNAAQWEPPTEFKRKTTKYWVDPEHATRVKLLIIRHMPILELTESARIKHKFHEQQTDQTHNFISSVYLDNDELTCYHNRIQRLEGAQLVRIRWYGGKREPGQTLPVPSGDLVFIERKTHHEKWVELDSAKERFPFSRSLLQPFFAGEVTPEKAFEIMVLQGLVKEKEVAKHLQLAHETQQLVCSLGLVPKLRTVYHRTAFQRSDSNQVRISFDVPCYFVKDVNRPAYWANLRHPEDDPTPFSHGVLEVKLVGDNPPPWVDELLATGYLTKSECEKDDNDDDDGKKHNAKVADKRTKRLHRENCNTRIDHLSLPPSLSFSLALPSLFAFFLGGFFFTPSFFLFFFLLYILFFFPLLLLVC